MIYKKQTTRQRSLEYGKVSLFHIVVASLFIVMIVVALLLYLPSNTYIEQYVEPQNDSEYTLPSLELTEEKATINKPTKIESATPLNSTLGYCADKDIEIIGYDWEQNIARAKTYSANRKSIDSSNLKHSPSYHQYSMNNRQSQYGDLQTLYDESDSLMMPMGQDIISEISNTKNDDFESLNLKYAGNKDYLTAILAVFSRQISIESFKQILDTHDDIDNDFIFKLFSSSFQISTSFLEVLLEKASGSSPLSKSYVDRGNDLLFLALSNGNFEYLPYILNMDINFYPNQDASLYYALKNGAQRTSMNKLAFIQMQQQLEIIVGPPSFNDLIAISLFTKDNVMDKFIDYGLNIEDYIRYTPNLDILDLSDKEIAEKLNAARRKWPLYILRVNPNSDCMNATEFHWTQEELLSWYNTRIKSDEDFAEVDKELAEISRLYVARANVMYYSGTLDLKPQEFRVDEHRAFFDNVVGAIFEPAPNMDTSEQLALLSAEINTLEKQEILRFYIISLVRSIRTLDASTNLGFVYNDSDMLAAVRAKNKNAINWLLKNGVGLSGADHLNNGVLKWLLLTKSENFFNPSQLENMPTIYNPSSLNPHELHYLQCENYGSVDAVFRRSEIGKDVKQQVRTDLCEKLSGYKQAISSPL